MPHEIHSPVYEALRLFLGEQWDIYRLLLRVCRKKPGRAVVHGLRTSLRRLGAGLAVLGELVELKGVAQLRKEFKAELHSLRDLRDSQVQQKAMKGQNDSKMIAEFRASLKKRCRRQQTCARKRLKRAKAAKLGYCMLKIEEVLVACGQDARRSHNAASQLEHMLEREFKALQACVQHAKASDPASMHATRIQFKKYRYLWQVAEPSIPLPLAVARRMKTVQTQLGNIQDTVVLIQSLSSFMIDYGEPNPDAGFLAFYRGALARQDRLIAKCLREKDKWLGQLTPAFALDHKKVA